jgi:phage shock protein C
MIGGVCGGLGQYLGLDPTLIRFFFVLLALGNGVGVLIYFLLWIVVPREGQGEFATGETIRAGAGEIAARARSLGGDVGTNLPQAGARGGGLIIGAALIVVGVIFFFQNLGLPWLWWLKFDALWPLLLIAGGVILLLRRTR